jgi:DNA-binding transcriptional MerR regulator
MTIDTLKVARRLREAGFSEPQAEAVVTAFQEGAESADLATKRDLTEAVMASKRDLAEAVGQLRSEMREMELRLKLEIETAARHTESRLVGMILGALGINLLGTLGAMFGLAKLLGH